MTDIKTANDVPESHTLVTDSYEVQHILEHIGADRDNVSLFVNTESGEYVSVLAFSGCVPYLYKPVERLL